MQSQLLLAVINVFSLFHFTVPSTSIIIFRNSNLQAGQASSASSTFWCRYMRLTVEPSLNRRISLAPNLLEHPFCWRHAANGSALGSIIILTSGYWNYQIVPKDSGRHNTYLEKPTVQVFREIQIVHKNEDTYNMQENFKRITTDSFAIPLNKGSIN
jgi:hypothetical protein